VGLSRCHWAAGDAPYWRGFIWININFLTLRALQRYSQEPGPHQSRALGIYK
jgi:mannosyl-oligosaccharide glucosidase